MSVEPEETPADSIPEPPVPAQAAAEAPTEVSEPTPVPIPERAASEEGPEPPVPAVAVAAGDALEATLPPTPTPAPTPVVSLGASLAAGYVTPPDQNKAPTKVAKAKSGEDPVIQFTPVTSAGMSAFFAAFRRNSTAMSFATSEGGEGHAESQEPPVQTLATEPTQPPAPAEPEPETPTATLAAEVAFHKFEPIPASTEPTVVATAVPPEPKAPFPKAGPVPTLPEPPAAPKACVAPPVAVPHQGSSVPAEPKACVAPTVPVPHQGESSVPAAPAPAVVIPQGSAPTAPAAPATQQQSQPLEALANQGTAMETEEPEPQSRGSRRAQYMRRSPFCPEPIRERFLAAQNAPPHEAQQQLQALFEEFRQCNEDWLTSHLLLEEVRAHETSCAGIWKWVTREEARQHVDMNQYEGDLA
eukprot:s2673_g7.t1